MAGAGLIAAPAAQAAAPGMLDTAASEACAVTDAELTWGFKEAFRSYISGTIANGEWTTADGATYATPDFSWTSGAGNYDGSSGEGLLGFTGSITFTGHGGILNTTVANPQLRFDDADTATLLLDVSGVTQQGVDVTEQAVEFAAVDLSAATLTVDEAIVSFAAAPAVLLEPGAAAFGTYEAGEELDPISVTFTSDADCIASDPASGMQPAWSWWLTGGILLLVVIAAAVFLARRRRRS